MTDDATSTERPVFEPFTSGFAPTTPAPPAPAPAPAAAAGYAAPPMPSFDDFIAAAMQPEAAEAASAPSAPFGAELGAQPAAAAAPPAAPAPSVVPPSPAPTSEPYAAPAAAFPPPASAPLEFAPPAAAATAAPAAASAPAPAVSQPAAAPAFTAPISDFTPPPPRFSAPEPATGPIAHAEPASAAALDAEVRAAAAVDDGTWHSAPPPSPESALPIPVAVPAATAASAAAPEPVFAAPPAAPPAVPASTAVLAPSEPEPAAAVFAMPSSASPGSSAPPAPEHDAAAPAPVSSPAAEARASASEGRRSARSHADPDLLWALAQVVSQGGSDLHVAVNAPPRIRLHGALEDLPSTVPWTPEKMEGALHSIMTPAQRETFEQHLELDFAFTLSADSRFRVNVYQQRGNLGAAFRLIPTEIKPLADLGVPASVSRFATLARGLVLVTGPTGSGKSTTLAGLIDLVNRTRTDHIVTVEDPIEFMHENKKSLVNQREVGSDTHSFANALKHVLRQDPDVILIGELRDLETISVALTAAETGHLVFATLHTQSAGQTIDRVIDVFPPHQQGQVRAQLASTLQGVVCQTLIPRASGGGRAVATEILVANAAIGNLIREGKTFQIPSALQAGRELGMHTLDQHLADLVNHGVITHQAAMEKAQDSENLRQLIHRAESGGSMAAAGMNGNF
ncbi:type IV pilus twitching motility protein PilT [Microcella flavibacter]|uniref:type IV pilus twitching motility protein PilT n=1 Tax=Microcella flavibacter TaxID=1804990 RepID=UPI002B27553F|nr:type IV pilus twitching motility protein PilT [Microcella flavibacter]